MSPHAQWTSVLLSEALLAHDVYVCLECPSRALPPELPPSLTEGRKGFSADPFYVRNQAERGVTWTDHSPENGMG